MFCVYRGFHLIELLVVLSIIAILAVSSLPTFTHYLVWTKRLQAESMLAKLAIALEHYSIERNTYKGATLAALNVTDKINTGDYQFSIQSATDDSYILTATPINHQAVSDHACATLSLNSQGEKIISGFGNAEDCWSSAM